MYITISAHRTPCKNKSDTDLPRYGKRWGFDHQSTSEVKAPGSVQGPLVAPQVTPEQGVEKGGKEAKEADEENTHGEKEGEEINSVINMVSVKSL